MKPLKTATIVILFLICTLTYPLELFLVGLNKLIKGLAEELAK